MPDTLPAHSRATDDRPPPLTADDLHWRRFLTDEVAFPEVPDHHREKAVSPAVRKEVMERDAYRCQRCGGYRDLHLDHIVPESRGGGSTPANLRVLCAACNLEKGNRTDEELGW